MKKFTTKSKKINTVLNEESVRDKSEHKTIVLHLCLLVLFWIFVSISFFGKSFIPTHDGEFHIIRFFEFYTMLAEGHLFPRWAPGLNSGYGMPLFIFHYPFPNYVGAAFHALGLSFIDSFKLSLVSGYLLAILACYTFLVKQTRTIVALISTILFATVPYWFIDMSIRGSIGEVWAIAWCVTALASLVHNKKLVFGLSILLLCLSHNIMAMILFPVLVGYVWILHRSFSIQLILGVLGAAYFWIPALAEKHYMVGLNTSLFSDHFPALHQLLIPSWGSGFSGPGASGFEMSQQIGLIPLSIVVISLITLVRKKKGEDAKRYVFSLCVFFISFFLMLGISYPVWNLITPLQFIQYPWRLLSLVIITIPLLSVFVLQRSNKFVLISVALLSVILTYSYMRPVLYEPRRDEQYIRNPNFSDGTSSMGNSFSTIWTSWKEERPSSRIRVESGSAQITAVQSTAIEDRFTITAQTPTDVSVHRLYYPGWVVTVNNREVPIDYEKNGILNITIPVGTYSVVAKFTETPLRILSNGVSLAACLLLVVSVIRTKKHEDRI